MKNGLKRLKNFIMFLRSDEVSMDAKSLYLVLIYSILVNIVYLVMFMLNGIKAGSCFAIGCIIYNALIMYLVGRFEEISFFKYVLVFSINIIIFPLSYFMTGNVLNGAVFFFVLGIVFTFFLIRVRWVYIIMVIELVWY